MMKLGEKNLGFGDSFQVGLGRSGTYCPISMEIRKVKNGHYGYWSYSHFTMGPTTLLIPSHIHTKLVTFFDKNEPAQLVLLCHGIFD